MFRIYNSISFAAKRYHCEKKLIFNYIRKLKNDLFLSNKHRTSNTKTIIFDGPTSILLGKKTMCILQTSFSHLFAYKLVKNSYDKLICKNCINLLRNLNTLDLLL